MCGCMCVLVLETERDRDGQKNGEIEQFTKPGNNVREDSDS